MQQIVTNVTRVILLKGNCRIRALEPRVPDAEAGSPVPGAGPGRQPQDRRFLAVAALGPF